MGNTGLTLFQIVENLVISGCQKWLFMRKQMDRLGFHFIVRHSECVRNVVKQCTEPICDDLVDKISVSFCIAVLLFIVNCFCLLCFSDC